MRKILFGVVFLMAVSVVRAEVINLHNGSSVTGEIKEYTLDKVIVDLEGTSITYFRDEIKNIDGRPFDTVAAESSALIAKRMAGASQVQPLSEAKRQLILQFVDAFGTRESMNTNFEQMMGSLSPEDAAKLRNAFKVDEIIERLIPLYHQNFSEDELTTLISFYLSGPGKKLVSVIPVLMRDSVEVSARYFEEKMPADFKGAVAGPSANP